MSRTPSARSPSSNFQLVFNNALKEYEKRTKNDLLSHPLAVQLQACDSPGAILSILQQQVQEFDQSRSTNEKWTKWLDPTVNVVYAFSGTVGGGISLAFPPASVIFAGVGVLLSTAKDVRASEDVLVDIFERIELFFRRLEIYTEVPPTPEMTDIIMKIMVEVLSILGIATKEIKQGRTKKYMKRLLGTTSIDDSLKRLDKLTQEEARMATAQALKVTYTIDEGVRGVADKVVGVDDRVASVDEHVTGVDRRVEGVDSKVVGVDNKLEAVSDRVASVDDRVADVGDQVRKVDNKIAVVIEDGKEARVVMQQAANDVDQMKRSQLRHDLRRWLSPPDPSTNHNIACNVHHEGTAAWFFQGRIFGEWKTTESLLWVHGKPGSGKSVLCSSIIEDIGISCKAGQASMCYFYFDFRDIRKQHWHDLVRSLLTQLCNRSGPCCDILSHLYDEHENGAQQPGDGSLEQSLKEMLTLHEHPIYLMIDALDECSDTSGIPSSRERVLLLLKDLVELRLSNLHVCVTSRPEIDIRDILEPLAAHSVSLHDQSGQKQDIMDYVRSIVYSKSEPIMSRWRKEDKEVVIATLSERADGMFRWVFCQLETLRHCFPSSVRRTLDALPESLDATYERVLREIKKPHRDHALRLLQCLVVATRPLRAEELAEVMAVDFDSADGIPKLNPNWRWEDQEQALLSSCSSLITIVNINDTDDNDNNNDNVNTDDNANNNADDDGDDFYNLFRDDYGNGGGNDKGNDNNEEVMEPRIVQFSHFSVKEFLTSPRLVAPSRDVSHYHILLEPAHTIMSQACLSILLRSDDPDHNSAGVDSPLAGYAAQHWVTHAQFGNVSLHLQNAVECLFDMGNLCFSGWLRLHNMDIPAQNSFLFSFRPDKRPSGSPLYYAALCGFQDLVECLIVKYPQQVNEIGGLYMTPAVAALAGGYFQLAKLLSRKGSSVEPRDFNMWSPLHWAAHYGDLEAMQVLLDCKADINSRTIIDRTPLHEAVGKNTGANGLTVVRFMLEHGANANARMQGTTPLHLASKYGRSDVTRLLIEHGAEVEAKDSRGRTPLQLASAEGRDEVVDLLLEYGTK